MLGLLRFRFTNDSAIVLTVEIKVVSQPRREVAHSRNLTLIYFE